MSDPQLFHMHLPNNGVREWIPIAQCRICLGLVRAGGLVLWNLDAETNLTEFTIVCSGDCAQEVHVRASAITNWGQMRIAQWYASLVGMTGVRDETIEHLENQALARFTNDVGFSFPQDDTQSKD